MIVRSRAERPDESSSSSGTGVRSQRHDRGQPDRTLPGSGAQSDRGHQDQAPSGSGAQSRRGHQDRHQSGSGAQPDRERPGTGAGYAQSPELSAASAALTEAEFAETASERFLWAHLAALRVAAVVLACRASGRVGRDRPRDVWQVLAEAAPEYAEWAGFFASSALKREAVRAGAVAMVSAREADDLVRDVIIFRDRVARRLGRAATPRREVS